MALDIDKLKKRLAQSGKVDAQRNKILRRRQSQLELEGASSETIENELLGLKMYLIYQHGTGIPFGEAAYMSDGLAIYPDGRVEDGW